jgi:ABC transporter substrate binding protein
VATRTIPIVFVLLADPVGTGLVASLARPSGNITGFVNYEFTIGAVIVPNDPKRVHGTPHSSQSGLYFRGCSLLNSRIGRHLLEWASAGAPRDNMLTSAECRARAEQKIAEAQLQLRHKRKLRGDAECWLVLADRMERLEASVGRSHGVAINKTLGDDG